MLSYVTELCTANTRKIANLYFEGTVIPTCAAVDNIHIKNTFIEDNRYVIAQRN